MTFMVYNSYACPISTLTIKVLEQKSPNRTFIILFIFNLNPLNERKVDNTMKHRKSNYTFNLQKQH